MRKVRHRNVVQFIGACTRKPNLCIVFEFMSGGSVYDYMRKVKPASPSRPNCQLCAVVKLHNSPRSHLKSMLAGALYADFAKHEHMMLGAADPASWLSCTIAW